MLRIFLGFTAILWLPYAISCFLDPSTVAKIAGVTASTATGTIDLQAMYGGIQAAIGIAAAIAVFRPAMQMPALSTLAIVASGMFTARLIAAVMAASFASYTIMALAVEGISAILAYFFLKRGVVTKAAS